MLITTWYVYLEWFIITSNLRLIQFFINFKVDLGYSNKKLSNILIESEFRSEVGRWIILFSS